MLVFTRKKNESIMIGPDIEIKVVAIGRDGVKLGIDAPRHIAIHRKEVFLAIEAENQAASVMTPDRLEQIKKAIQAAQLERKKGASEEDPSR
ncbi:MAG: carbon storage regulator CsrA [Acidobacteria bacterium]|nr:carbon storage regulator CsrA [Acidobacteriota bacterium]MCB9397007.1 carbon storage regulator CsrA [Acidobacteriota bacterium]